MKKGCIIGRMFKFLFKALSVTFVVLFTVYMLLSLIHISEPTRP